VDRELTFRREITKGSSAIALYFNTWGVCQRYEDIKYAEIQEVGLELIAQGKDGNGCCHLRLDTQRHVQHELFAFLDSAGFQNESLVPIRARREISKRRDGMALYLLIVSGSQ
jgi:hypothetical protein